MDDYKISLGAILDANAKGDLQKSIDAIKDLNIKISKAELSQSAIADIKRQFEQNGIDLNIVFGNTSQIANQAKQTGQQIGKQINQGLSQSMGNSDAIIERFKKSLSNTGMDTHGIDVVVNRLKSLDVQIDSLNQKVATSFSSKNYGEDILSVDVSGVDKMGQAIKIVDQYNLATGEYLKTVQSVSTAHEKAGNSVEEFVTKQKKAIASLQNDYNKVLASSLDTNSSRPITSDSSYKALEQQIDKVETAMSELKNSTATTFDDAKIRVQEEISALKILEKQLRNADNVSTKLRGNSVDTGFGIAINDLEKLKADSKEYVQMSDTIQNLEKALGSVSDSASLNKFNDSLREARSELAKLKSEAMSNNRAEKVGINVSDFQSKIEDLKRISPEIKEFKAQINGAEVTIESFADELSNVKTQGDISVLNTKWRAFTDAAKAAGIAVKEVADSSNARIQLKIDTGEYDSKVTDLLSKTGQWTNLTNAARSSVDGLRTAYQAFASAPDGNAKIEAARQLEIEIKRTTNAVREMNAVYATDSSISVLQQKYQAFYDKNTAAHHKWGVTLKAAITELGSGAPITLQRLQQLERELLKIGTAARQSGKLGLSFFGKLKQGMSTFSYWTSSTMIVMRSVYAIKSAITSVKDLDTALVDLKKTTSMTSAQLEEFYYSANETAKQMGVTTEEIINQASAWSRLGYSSQEAATKMAKYSSMFASISPGMDVDKATDGLVSIMKAFDIGNDNPDDVLDGIMSKVNIIGNTAATSNDEIVTMLEKSSSAMKEANNSLEETIALETAAVEITRDDDAVGTAFKTVAMRIRGYDEETESYTNDIAQLSGDIADLTKTAEKPSGISLFTDSSKTEYKSTYQILKEISEIYDELTDKQQADLLEKLAGKRQGQIIAATINNFKAAEKAMDDMANSAGSAEAEMNIIMESVEYKANELKETGVGIAQNLFKRDDMKTVLSFITTLANGLDTITGKLGLFGTLAVGGGLFAGLNNVGGLKFRESCLNMPDLSLCKVIVFA